MFHKSIATILSPILLFGAHIAAADPPKRSVGEETRRWLELQSSGAAASTTRQTVSGPVADAIYQRYVESFKHPIPEFYKSDKDGGSGDGSSR
ncbi:DUF3613 domain-containing protein [Methylomicrobium agile]|uniref:DUF3613 domain-containing protein n=1 Tax=Methylomicrobium agile TaxID=39774 RepID=UPI0004DFBA81|nr:DUF3613 domain-containing protein [Methylomicrobium agile]